MNTTLKPPDINFLSDALPEKGADMKVWFENDSNGVRWYYVDRGYRNGAGKPRHFRRKTKDSQQHLKNQVEALQITGASSLTSKRFSECVELYHKERGTGGHNKVCYRRASEELGRLYPDQRSFASAYSAYCSKLEASKMAVNTAKNYKIIVRTVCNFAYKTGRCGVPTVREWRISFGEERSRILSDGEKLCIENVMRDIDSPLLPHFLFSLVNPIRKQDLLNLRRTALKVVVRNGHRVFRVELVQQKTARRAKIKTTVLPNVDEAFAEYEASLPSDCPWLFPLLVKDERGNVTGWYKVTDFKKRFKTILRRSGVEDFNWHDLCHCAVTHMVKQGFSYNQLQKLGIKSPKVLKIYDNRSTEEIIESVLGDNPGQRSQKVDSGEGTNG